MGSQDGGAQSLVGSGGGGVGKASSGILIWLCPPSDQPEFQKPLAPEIPPGMSVSPSLHLRLLAPLPAQLEEVLWTHKVHPNGELWHRIHSELLRSHDPQDGVVA